MFVEKSGRTEYIDRRNHVGIGVGRPHVTLSSCVGLSSSRKGNSPPFVVGEDGLCKNRCAGDFSLFVFGLWQSKRQQGCFINAVTETKWPVSFIRAKIVRHLNRLLSSKRQGPKSARSLAVYPLRSYVSVAVQAPQIILIEIRPSGFLQRA